MSVRESDGAPAPAAKKMGRPRVTAVDERIIEAAQAVYAARGWSGFNFDVVAQQARVSKDALYRRYSGKLDLLVAITSRALPQPPPASVADIRAYLLHLATEHFRSHVAPHGLNSLRIFIEARHNPELAQAHDRQNSNLVMAEVHSALRDAMNAGLLPQATSPEQVTGAVFGGIIMHVLMRSTVPWQEVAAEEERFVPDLVDLILRGCGYPFPEDHPQPNSRS